MKRTVVSVYVALVLLWTLASSSTFVGAGELDAFSLQGCFREVHGPDAMTVTEGAEDEGNSLR